MRSTLLPAHIPLLQHLCHAPHQVLVVFWVLPRACCAEIIDERGIQSDTFDWVNWAFDHCGRDGPWHREHTLPNVQIHKEWRPTLSYSVVHQQRAQGAFAR
eukprot:3579382-Pyramimonas_sp.AAC.1